MYRPVRGRSARHGCEQQEESWGVTDPMDVTGVTGVTKDATGAAAGAGVSVRAFFERFERAGKEDPEDAVACFAPVFLSADPTATQPLTREELRAALPYRERMFASMGVSGLRLGALSEEALGENHLLVRAQWITEPAAGGHGNSPGDGAGTGGEGDDVLTLDSTYVLQRAADGTLQIVFYLNHQDMAALAAAGTTTVG